MGLQVRTCLVGVMAILLCAGIGSGAVITTPTDPLLNGATIIDFEGQTKGFYTSLTIGDVTFTALDNHLGIDNYYSSSYGTQGMYLDNGIYDNPGFASLRMDFATPVSAFGHQWGAADNGIWTLSAYDSSDNLVDTYSPLPNTGELTEGAFVGLGASGIDHAVLSHAGGYDWIFIDQFTYTAGGSVVPAPGAILLGGIGIGLVGWLRRRQTL